MGIGQKIALTGGLSIAAVLALLYVANKTDIFNKFIQGARQTGATLGQALGGGVSEFFTNIPGSFFSGTQPSSPTGTGKLGLTPDVAAQNLRDNITIGGLLDPLVNWLGGSSGSTQAQTQSQLQDNTVVTPANRENSDYIKDFGNWFTKGFNSLIPSFPSASGEVQKRSALPFILPQRPHNDTPKFPSYYGSGSSSRNLTPKSVTPTISYSKAVTGGNRPAPTSSNKNPFSNRPRR